jgi:hypothetical protein
MWVLLHNCMFVACTKSKSEVSSSRAWAWSRQMDHSWNGWHGSLYWVQNRPGAKSTDWTSVPPSNKCSIKVYKLLLINLQCQPSSWRLKVNINYLDREHQFTKLTVKWLLVESMHSAHASEAKLSALADDSSASDGFDSCFAAAWRTRSWTAVVEGDVARPILLGSSFLAAQDNASAPNLTGENNSLHKERERGENFIETAPDLQAHGMDAHPQNTDVTSQGNLL